MISVISSRSWENSLKPRTAHRWPRNERLQFLWRRADLGAQITCQLESEPSQHRDSIPPGPHPTSPYKPLLGTKKNPRSALVRFRRGLGIAASIVPRRLSKAARCARFRPSSCNEPDIRAFEPTTLGGPPAATRRFAGQ
jgi:hypothetical protein